MQDLVRILFTFFVCLCKIPENLHSSFFLRLNFCTLYARYKMKPIRRLSRPSAPFCSSGKTLMKYQNEANRVESLLQTRLSISFFHVYPSLLFLVSHCCNYVYHRVFIVIVSTLQKIKTAPEFLIWFWKQRLELSTWLWWITMNFSTNKCRRFWKCCLRRSQSI